MQPRDRHLLWATAFVRALATGMVGVLLGVYLARLELAPAQVGLVIGAGLVGSACATSVATFVADRVGRVRFLQGLSALSLLGALGVTVSSSWWLIAVAAFVGMLNGMGRDRGAALAVEAAVLPATAPAEGRTRAFAVYHLLQDTGHALGALLAGLPAVLQGAGGVAALGALRFGMGSYAALVALALPLYRALSPAVEVPVHQRHASVSADSRRVLWKVCSLFALDSLGGGFLTTALLSYFFVERFGVGVGTVGVLFFLARMANALSHLGAAWLARHIGLVNTMVFTHVPSSLVLVTVAYAPSFPVAAALFLLRESLVEMDVPTRQSYVMAVVRPEERMFASGVTHLVRVGGWAVAPAFAGLFMQAGALLTPLLVGAGMKVLYDGLLYISFRRLRPPEEQGSGRTA